MIIMLYDASWSMWCVHFWIVIFPVALPTYCKWRHWIQIPAKGHWGRWIVDTSCQIRHGYTHPLNSHLWLNERNLSPVSKWIITSFLCVAASVSQCVAVAVCWAALSESISCVTIHHYCVAVCYSALQGVAMCCSCSVMSRAIGTDLLCHLSAPLCCSELQCIAVCCSVLQRVAIAWFLAALLEPVTFFNCVAVCCMLQCVAMCCSVLQLHCVKQCHQN